MDPSDPQWIRGGRQYNVTTWALRYITGFSVLCLAAIVFSDGSATKMDALVSVAMYLAGVCSVAIGGVAAKNSLEARHGGEEE
jgi:hypothetical protein